MSRPDNNPPGFLRTVVVLLIWCSIRATVVFAADPAIPPLPTGCCIPAGQLIVAIGETAEETDAELFAFEKTSSGWEKRFGPLAAVNGRNGFAPPGEKREGDGRTPTGLFPLEFAFGYARSIDSKMPYRQATDDDVWVDDPASPDYNTWTKRDLTDASSFETMKLTDQRYRIGISIAYNRNPIITGMGSAIFLHVWLREGAPTSGCIAIADEDLSMILQWLDPAKKPMILMGTRPWLAAFPEAPRQEDKISGSSPTP